MNSLHTSESAPHEVAQIEIPQSNVVLSGIQRFRGLLRDCARAQPRSIIETPNGVQRLRGNSRIFVITNSGNPQENGTILYRSGRGETAEIVPYPSAYNARRRTVHQRKRHQQELHSLSIESCDEDRMEELQEMLKCKVADRDVLDQEIGIAEQLFKSGCNSITNLIDNIGTVKVMNGEDRFKPSEHLANKFVNGLQDEMREFSAITTKPFVTYIQALATHVQRIKDLFASGEGNNKVIPDVRYELHEMYVIYRVQELQKAMEEHKLTIAETGQISPDIQNIIPDRPHALFPECEILFSEDSLNKLCAMRTALINDIADSVAECGNKPHEVAGAVKAVLDKYNPETLVMQLQQQ